MFFLYPKSFKMVFAVRRFPVSLAPTCIFRKARYHAEGVFHGCPSGLVLERESPRGRERASNRRSPWRRPPHFWCHFGLSWLSFVFSDKNHVFVNAKIRSKLYMHKRRKQMSIVVSLAPKMTQKSTKIQSVNDRG